ncbi:MAG TPA: YfhO family protein [Gemmatimonadales bacterium]|nr:YfhO family protein [Gemmatimonadales bacterium]
MASFLLVVFVAILSWPIFQGQWLAGLWSDQFAGGYAVRQWAAEQWRATGTIPLWNPMIFGGLPYVATVGHGDVFYPTSFLRYLLEADLVLSISFALHTALAGIFTYLFLRRMGISWLGSVVGGLAYQLSGIIISLPSPGHDGKLFVSTLLPMAFLAVHAAVKERRWWGYGLLGSVVAGALLSPHVQMTYYMLLASGLFALYCAFGEADESSVASKLTRLALALGAVGLGFGIAAPQLLPFLEYIAHSPRAESYHGFEASASYAIPWNHVPEFLVGGFSGENDTYWGTNPLKLHSEYLGLPVVALAVLGFTDRRRRLVWWLGGIGLLFLLVSLGASTPFYRVWWTVMPMVKKSRAPGMAFYIVAFVMAAFAALGTARLERQEGKLHVKVWLAVAGLFALLALAGAFGNMAVTLAPPERVSAAQGLGDAIRWSALFGSLALGAVALLALGAQLGKVPATAFALALPLIVGADLWRDGRRFWTYQPPARQGLYREDPLVQRLRQEPLPYRVLDLSALMGAGAYPLNVLQGHGVPQVLGYFGFELRYYDDLLGGKNEWRYLISSTRLWNLLAVKYVITPDTMVIPGYHRVLGPVQTGAGRRAWLYEADSAPPYARVVPAVLKVADERIPPTLADARLPGFDRVVFVPEDAPVNSTALSQLPAPSNSRARVTAWRPGAMTIELDPAPESDSYLLVSENWYVDWRATVDGSPAQVLRGDHALITVPVRAGARRVELEYHSAKYAQGRAIAYASLAIVLASFVAPLARRRRQSG